MLVPGAFAKVSGLERTRGLEDRAAGFHAVRTSIQGHSRGWCSKLLELELPKDIVIEQLETGLSECFRTVPA